MSADAVEIYHAHREAGRVVSASGFGCDSMLLIHPDDWTELLDAIGPTEVAGDDLTAVRVFGHRVVLTSSLGRVEPEVVPLRVGDKVCVWSEDRQNFRPGAVLLAVDGDAAWVRIADRHESIPLDRVTARSDAVARWGRRVTP